MIRIALYALAGGVLLYVGFRLGLGQRCPDADPNAALRGRAITEAARLACRVLD